MKRLTTAYLKLFFPNVRSVDDVDREQFKQFCLIPATKMRGIIQQQLQIIDHDEYSNPYKQMPKFTLRDAE